MKIAVNSRQYLNSHTGIGYYILYLYQELVASDQSNQYLFLQTNARPSLGQTVAVGGNSAGLRAIWFDLWSVDRLLAKQPGIQLFHGPAHVLPLRKRRRIKYILTIHDLSFKVYPHDYPWLFRLYYPLAAWLSIKRADLIVADSQSTARDLMRFYKLAPEKIKVIHLGVSDKFSQAKQMPRPVSEKYLFSTCTHPKRKNINRVLEALAQTPALASYKYVIAGLVPPSQLTELKERIKGLKLDGRVVLLGYVDDSTLIALYQHAEFFIFPSLYEGFGLPVLEAMAAGCPVITSANSSLTEVTADSTWLVDPTDVSGMSAAMKRIVSLSPEAKQSLIRRNQAFASGFNWKKTADQMKAAFESLAG